jgi:hypothetical protein
MTCWSNLEHTTSNPDALCRPSGEACQAAKKSSARPYAGIQQGESLCTLPTSSGGVLVITGSRSGAYHLSGQGYAGCCIRTSENAPSRDCLENSRRHLERASLAAGSGRSGPLRPLLAAFGVPIRDLFRFSKQFRKGYPPKFGCTILHSPGPIESPRTPATLGSI